MAQAQPLQQQTTRSIQQIETRSGPLPEAVELERYEKLLPGLADRIVKMAESETTTRQRRQDTALQAQIDDAKRGRLEKRLGQIFAFLLASGTLTLSYLAAINGAATFGAIIGGLSIGSLCVAFLVGRAQPSES